MPELPEVETIRRGLEKRILGQKIKRVEIRKSKVIRNQPGEFTRGLTGQSFTGIARRGKLLIVEVKNSEQYLLIHLKMTGQLIYQHGAEVIAGGHSWPRLDTNLPNKYTRVIFTFADQSKLYFNDLRQFGYLHLVDQAQLAQIEKAYGLEPLLLTFRWQNLREVLGKRRVSIKAALLNQQLIAGIGNIYADEICFAARVRPTRRVSSLTLAQIKRLHQACRQILRRALRFGGTTFSNYRDVEGSRGNFTRLLKVYGRAGEECRRCSHILTRATVAGRGTVYCPNCQL